MGDGKRKNEMERGEEERGRKEGDRASSVLDQVNA